MPGDVWGAPSDRLRHLATTTVWGRLCCIATAIALDHADVALRSLSRGRLRRLATTTVWSNRLPYDRHRVVEHAESSDRLKGEGMSKKDRLEWHILGKPHADRAKQFKPFAALRGYDEMVVSEIERSAADVDPYSPFLDDGAFEPAAFGVKMVDSEAAETVSDLEPFDAATFYFEAVDSEAADPASYDSEAVGSMESGSTAFDPVESWDEEITNGNMIEIDEYDSSGMQDDVSYVYEACMLKSQIGMMGEEDVP